MHTITAMVRGGAETTLDIDPAVVRGSPEWENTFLPQLATALGLNDASEIAAIYIRDSDGDEGIVDSTQKLARKSVATLAASDCLIVEVGRPVQPWLDAAQENDPHWQDIRCRAYRVL